MAIDRCMNIACYFCVPELGRFGRSSSTSGARQVGGCDVQRQSSLPHREALSQVNNTYYYNNDDLWYYCDYYNLYK